MDMKRVSTVILFDISNIFKNLMGFLFAQCALWTLFFVCSRDRRGGLDAFCASCLPLVDKVRNMASSSASGCCFASAVAYLLWKYSSGALTACGWAWACWRQRWSRCASLADLCWGWKEQKRSSRWTHPRHWPPGEPERLRGTNRNQRGKEGRKESQRDSKGTGV